jgi:putative lipoprotein
MHGHVRRPAAAAAALLCALLVAGCSMSEPAAGGGGTAVLEGKATYRERIALPPGAVFEASIQDVAIADAPATLLARTRFTPEGQVPIAFRIEYDPAKLDPRARYALSARITVDGRLRWITDQYYPAFVDGRPQPDTLLLRAVEPAPAPGARQPLRGDYFYMADAATFTDCQTGRRMPVAMEGDAAALERAYLAAGGSQRGPMLASIEGRIEERPPMEGDGLLPTVIVDRFVSIDPAARCAAGNDAAPLAGTYWKAVQLLGAAVQPAGGERGPPRQAHLRFDAATGRVGGTGGCNMMAGSYTARSDAVEFSQLISTMMACVDGMEGDQRLTEALKAARRWVVTGRQLELRDATGKPVARFEATNDPDAGKSSQ